MRPAEWLQEVRMRRFEEAHEGWTERRLTQAEAARLLGVSERTFRRYVERYDDGGTEALVDRRLSQVSHRKAPVDEVLALCERYRARHTGWSARHFHTWYRRSGGRRSYTWVKSCLQEARLVKKAPRRGVHRKRRERAPWPGVMLHQDGSRHEWVPGQKWDLILTMDDATNEHYSMFFVDEEGTKSSFRGVGEVIRAKGLFSSFYSDRASHYWHTPEAGKRVDKKFPTQFGRAMAQLGIEMIPAYSPEARGRIERAFRTHQDRLLKELALHGITGMEEANRYLQQSPPTTPSLYSRPWKRGLPSSSASSPTSTTSCASSTTGASAATTASPSRGENSRSRPTGIGATTSRPRSGCIATKTTRWPSFTVQGNWQPTTSTGS